MKNRTGFHEKTTSFRGSFGEVT